MNSLRDESNFGWRQTSPCPFTSAGKATLLLFLLICGFAPTAALAQRGRMEQGQITSSALTNNLLGDSALRRYRVYLPPSYDSLPKAYPVIYVLHGYSGNENAMVNGLQSSLDSMFRQRAIGEMIAVFVNGQNRLNGSFYLSSPVIGDYETYITKDLVDKIDREYRTLATRESRGITGFSMGGWGTMQRSILSGASSQCSRLKAS